jgi:hypothetical protein
MIFEHRVHVGDALFCPLGRPDPRFVTWIRNIRQEQIAMEGRGAITMETREDYDSFLDMFPEFTPHSPLAPVA